MRLPVRVFFACAAFGVLFAFGGCGEGYPSSATGGTGTSLAGTSSTGGASATGGTAVASSGNLSTGGTFASGGLPSGGVGGALAAGGTPNSGGSPAVTGGTSFGTGGANGGTSPGSGGISSIGNGGGAGTAGIAGGGASGGAAGAPLGGQGGVAGKGGASQGGVTASGGADAVSFAVAENIIGNNCAGCHVNRRPIFTTSGTTLYNTLISTVVKQCGNHKLVVPNDPTNSAIIELVTSKCNGYKMPTSCSDPVCLVPDDLSRLTSWISLGAKNE